MERCGSLTNAKSDYCHNAKTVFIRKGAGCYISVTSVVPHEDVRSTISAYDTKANQDMFKQQSYLNLYQLSIDFANDLIKSYTTKENKSIAPNNNSASRLYPNLKEDTLHTAIKKIHDRSIKFVDKVKELDNSKNMICEVLYPTGRFKVSNYEEKAGMLAQEIIIDMLSIIENENTDPTVKNLISTFKDEYANCINVKDFYVAILNIVNISVYKKYNRFIDTLRSKAKTVIADSKRTKEFQVFVPKGMKPKTAKYCRILMYILGVSICLLSVACFIASPWSLILFGAPMTSDNIMFVLLLAEFSTPLCFMGGVILIETAQKFTHEVDKELVIYSITKKSFEVLANILDEREVNGNQNISINWLYYFLSDLERTSSGASRRISDHLELIRKNMNRLIDSADDFNEINYKEEITKISKNIIEDLFKHLKSCCKNKRIKNIISEREKKYKENINMQKFISDMLYDVDMYKRTDADTYTTKTEKKTEKIDWLTKKAFGVTS